MNKIFKKLKNLINNIKNYNKNYLKKILHFKNNDFKGIFYFLWKII